jgi:hypothetical protein
LSLLDLSNLPLEMQVITNGLEQSVQNMDEAERKQVSGHIYLHHSSSATSSSGPQNRNGRIAR